MPGRLSATASLALASVLLWPVTAASVPITGLFNTGVNASGTPLANNAAEQHYSLVTVPSGSTGVRVATSANGFPIPPWVGDNLTSAWIGPTGATDLTGPVGNYDYRTTFSLSAQDALRASIAGQWAVDNAGIDILLNGVSTGNTATDFQTFYNFTITAGFIGGTNTLDFIVNNAPPASQTNPTGLRTQLVGVIPITEPATVMLVFTALVMLLYTYHRRRAGQAKAEPNALDGKKEGRRRRKSRSHTRPAQIGWPSSPRSRFSS